MTYKKEHLEGLIKLINQIVETPGNEWFVEELRQSTIASSNISFAELNKNIEDVRRTKYYLKNIDKTFYIEAFGFYKNIKDPSTKESLISDYKEMKIAFSDNNFLEYGRRMCMQLERCFDFIIINVDGWNVINTDVRFSSSVFVNSGRNEYNFKEKFFENTSGEIKAKEISWIEFRAKGLFCFIYYGLDYLKFWQTFDDIYFLRNMASHGVLGGRNENRLKKISHNIYSNIGFYFRFFQIIKKFDALYK